MSHVIYRELQSRVKLQLLWLITYVMQPAWLTARRLFCGTCLLWWVQCAVLHLFHDKDVTCPYKSAAADIATGRLHVNSVHCAHDGLRRDLSLSVLVTIHDCVAGR